MKEKGFTIVELIISIAIISVIGTISIVLLKKNKEEDTRILQIEQAGTAYMSNQEFVGQCLSIEELIKEGYLKEEDFTDYKNRYLEFSIEEDGLKIMSISSDSNCKYEDTKYNVTYILDGGSIKFLADDEEKIYNDEYIESYKYNEKITISNKMPEKTGYEFIGWSLSNGGEVKYRAGDKYTIYKDITLYAIYADSTCTLVYNIADAGGYNYDKLLEYSSDYYIYLENDETKEKYTFFDETYEFKYPCGETVDILDVKSNYVELDYWESLDGETLYRPKHGDTTFNGEEENQMETTITLTANPETGNTTELIASSLGCWVRYDCPDADGGMCADNHDTYYMNGCLPTDTVKVKVGKEPTKSGTEYQFDYYFDSENRSKHYHYGDEITFTSSEVLLLASWSIPDYAFIRWEGTTKSVTLNGYNMGITGNQYIDALSVGDVVVIKSSVSNVVGNDSGPTYTSDCTDIFTINSMQSWQNGYYPAYRPQWTLTYKGGEGTCSLYIKEADIGDSGDDFDGDWDNNDFDWEWSPYN